MSHLGIKILYGLVNRREDAVAERVFAPWHDMEEEAKTQYSFILTRNTDAN